MIDVALLLLRTVTGGLVAGHGAQKLFGAFEGPGPEGTAGMMGKLGMEPSDFWARVAGGTELAGGALTAAGLLSPLGPVTALGPMAIAATMAHAGRPIWVTKGGAELPVTNASAFAALALAGPGRLSLDGLLGIRLPRWVGIAATAGVGGGVVGAHLMRRAAQRAKADQAMMERAAQLEGAEVELQAEPQRRQAPASQPAG